MLHMRTPSCYGTHHDKFMVGRMNSLTPLFTSPADAFTRSTGAIIRMRQSSNGVCSGTTTGGTTCVHVRVRNTEQCGLRGIPVLLS